MRREELAVRGSVYGREFCFGEDRKPYRCEIGYCCGDSECCTYYYELWWFWLAWTLIILAGCCCACRHRRVKLRHQHELRQREISLMAYQGFPPPAAALEPWPNCKLPTYDEVTQDPPTPPPPYCEILDEAETGGGTPQLPVASSTNCELERSDQGEPSPEEPQSMVEHDLPHHDSVEEESLSALDRRRHVTGDSGIVLCDEKLVCMSEREGETALSRGGYISVDSGASTA